MDSNGTFGNDNIDEGIDEEKISFLTNSSDLS